MSSNRNDRSTLGYLGADFQLKLVKCFFEDQKYFANIQEIVDQNMFSNEHLRRIVGFMKDRYNFNETVTTYFEMETIIRSKVSDAISVEQLLAHLEKIKEMDLTGMDLVEEESENFFKQQNLTKAINKAQDIIKKGEFDNYYVIEDVIKKALETNTKEEGGKRLFENIDKTLSEDAKIRIPTGADKLDATLHGGLAKGELGVIIAPSGIGKAQPLTSKVLTPTGFKTMGEMKVGEMVIGGDGKPHQVIGVFPQGKRPVYKVSFSNGTSCECDIDHLWNVNTYYQRTRKTYVKGSGVKNMKREYNSDKTFKTWSLREIIDRGIIKYFPNSGRKTYVFKVPVVKPIEFDKQEVPINPYLAGYYIGDGCFQKQNISVGIQDKESAFNELSVILKDELHPFFNEKRNIWSFNLTGSIRKKCIDTFGVCNSKDKEIPECYLLNTKEVRISILQGLMDSDGTVYKNGHSEFNTKSKKLAEQVTFLVKSLGGYVSVKEKKSSYFNKKYNKRIDCGISYRVSIMLNDENISLYRFKRKQDRVKYRTKYKESIYITDVEYLREDETQCILVDSDEHLYVTDDFIVTHNTSATTGFAANAAITKCKSNNDKGFKVLHYFFEDEENDIERKYYGFLTGYDAGDLHLPHIRPYVIEILNENAETKRMLRENIKFERLISGEVTASQIKNKIRHEIALGFKPDLVIIDYFECLKAEKGDKSDSEWTKEAITMRKLEAIAHEFDIAIWVPIQGTKDSLGQELVGLMHAGGSVKKIQIAHVIITFAASDAMKLDGKLNIAIGKFRGGKLDRNKFMNVYFNNGTCRFDMSEVDENNDDMSFDEKQSSRLNEIARQTKQTYQK